jgi:arylsulfatase A-like enzyme
VKGSVRLSGVVLALSAGSIDVCVALLDKPRGFELFAAVPPAILATAAVVLPVYMVAWLAIRRGVTKRSLDHEASALALAAGLGSAFTLSLLVGLHTAALSPQTILKAAIVAGVSALLGAGVYALDMTTRRSPVVWHARRSLVAALPVLLFNLLVFDWLQVYAVDRPVSALSALITVALVVATAATIAAFHFGGRRWPATRALVTFAVLLAAVPAVATVATVATRRTGTVQARPLPSEGGPQRIILITIDTLRADALSTYRPSAPRTASIDQLASDGVVFEHAMSPAPWTLPSVTSILTGLAPSAHQAIGFTSSVSRNITTVAESLRERGYQTAAIVHNDLLNPKNGLSQGFAEYVTLDEQYFSHSIGMTALQAATPRWFPPPSWPSNDDQTRLAVEWLEANRDRHFFLWLHYLDPHAPYAPPHEYRTADPAVTIGPSFEGQKAGTHGFFVPSLQEREAIRALYDGEVRYVDANIGRLLEALKRLGLYDGALMVLTSDHGEEFWEHGQLGHGHSMYDELLRVPLIVKLPGSTHRGRTSLPVSTTSVAPTILEASRIRYDTGNVSAPSLLPVIDRAAPFEAQPIVSGAQIAFDRHEALVYDGFKYIVSTVDGREQLFDLRADPREQQSIASSAVERLETGRRLLQAQTDAAAALRKRLRVEEGTIPADEDTARRLRSLGYLR